MFCEKRLSKKHFLLGQESNGKKRDIHLTFIYIYIYLKDFQPMTSAPDNSSLLSDQYTNHFLVYVEIEPRSLIQLLETLLIYIYI